MHKFGLEKLWSFLLLLILTTTLLLSNEWSQMIQMQEKYETITPSFDVVASQPMPRPYMKSFSLAMSKTSSTFGKEKGPKSSPKYLGGL